MPKEYADAFLQWSVQQMAQSMGIGGGVPQPNMMMKQPQALPPIMQQPQQPAQAPLTQAAMRGLVDSSKPVL